MLYSLWLKFWGKAAEAGALAVYYLALTPAAALYRIFHGDFLGLGRRPSAGTYFRSCSRTFTPADLEKPW